MSDSIAAPRATSACVRSPAGFPRSSRLIPTAAPRQAASSRRNTAISDDSGTLTISIWNLTGIMRYRARMSTRDLSRRAFLSITAAAPFALSSALKGAYQKIPVGLELYSVRGELAKDLLGTVAAVGKMGYQDVEFISPLMQCTADTEK